MSIDKKLTTDGDLDFDAGGEKNLQILTDEKENIAQRLRIRLRSFKGDWFLDLDDGLPYYNDIFGKNVSLSTIQALLVSKISTTPGIISLLKFEFLMDIELRTLDVDFEVKTSGGTLIINESII